MVKWSHATSWDHEYRAPNDLTYLPYQNAGIAWADKHKRVLIGDTMGLGKTVQAIGFMNQIHDFYKSTKILVVCPASLKLNWKKEILKWLHFPPSTIAIPTSKKPTLDSEIVLVNYEMLSKFKEILSQKWDIVIFDEMQYLSNPEAKRSIAAKQIRTEYLVGLSGTPMANRPIQLWNILDTIQPAQWGTYHEFGLRYAGAFKKFNPFKRGQDKMEWCYSGNPQNMPELQSRLRSSVMIRRMKDQVLKDLPDKVYTTTPLPAVPRVAREFKRYQALCEDREADENLKRGMMAQLKTETGKAKVKAAIEIIENILSTGQKLVVFAYHQDVLDSLQAAFTATSVRICGAVPSDQRQPLVDRFQTDPMINLFIGQIVAAGTGLTLTASAHVLFVENDWTPGNMQQAEDRCHRIGQKNSVTIQYLELEESLDGPILRSLSRKSENIAKSLN